MVVPHLGFHVAPCLPHTGSSKSLWPRTMNRHRQNNSKKRLLPLSPGSGKGEPNSKKTFLGNSCTLPDHQQKITFFHCSFDRTEQTADLPCHPPTPRELWWSSDSLAWGVSRPRRSSSTPFPVEVNDGALTPLLGSHQRDWAGNWSAILCPAEVGSTLISPLGSASRVQWQAET